MFSSYKQKFDYPTFTLLLEKLEHYNFDIFEALFLVAPSGVIKI